MNTDPCVSQGTQGLPLPQDACHSAPASPPPAPCVVGAADLELVQQGLDQDRRGLASVLVVVV